MKRKNYRLRRKIKLLVAFFALVGGGIFLYSSSQNKPDDHQHFNSETKDNITVIDDRSTFIIPQTQAETIDLFLQEQAIKIGEHDTFSHDRNDTIFSGEILTITRGKKVILLADNTQEEFYARSYSIKEALKQKNISLGTFDIITPPLINALSSQQEIEIIRVRVDEEVRTKKIPFDTIAQTDDKMGWREEKVTQIGTSGSKEIIERVSYHDDTEVGREVISEEIVSKPTDEIVTEGTYVELGKKHKGAASWYAHTGTLSAANPWMPIGSYAKVTNTANGESVIVRINDRGPFVPGRIIDLDKVAWQKIASLGAGVINVKVEEVLN